jgi:prepilin-type N-terminal cleavage/methylation domain-containing protein
MTAERSDDSGFTLIETMVAMFVLMVGLLGLAQVFALGMRQMATSTYDAIAREKAREAIESVHTARDTRTITWSQIKNVANGGVFLDGEQPLKQAGADGLMNTADDSSAALEEELLPGPDGILGTTDDIHQALSGFRRTITITDITGEPSLRQLRVTIRYTVGATSRTYVLTTYVSSYA